MSIELNQANKRLVWDFWTSLEASGPDAAEYVAASCMVPNMPWHGPDPINGLTGASEFSNRYWRPLLRAFPDLRRSCHMFMGGRSNGRADGRGDGRFWAGGTGWFTGTFTRDWLNISPHGREVRIRWGELCCVENGRISEIFLLLDIVDLMKQAGFAILPPTRGKDGIYPPPQNDDAVYLEPQERRESDFTLDLIRRFIFDALNVYDKENLESMGIADYFHPNVRWYGPGGIGACFGLKEFEDLHQRHWLHAFPDRTVQPLDCLFAEGNYTAAAGWHGVRATHLGRYLGCPPTGVCLGVNGLDFWRREGDRFTENWVFVDMLHLFRQFGVDLLARISPYAGFSATI
jgi:predicted ester cyclase